MMGHIKSIKMSGLTQKLFQTLADLRLAEMKAATPFRVIGAITSAIAQIPMMIAPVVAFAMYTAISSKTGQVLDATKLFAALSLVILLANPLFFMFETVLDISAALGCLHRMDTYLSEPPRAEYRSLPSSSSPRSPSDGSQLSSQDVPLRDLKRAEAVVVGQTPGGDAAIRVESSSLRWNSESSPVLNDLDFSISKGQLVMFVGPIASGKSTILKGLLGELPHVTGNIALSSDRISWCEQSPWLIVSWQTSNAECPN